MNVVDTSAWLEYFSGGKNADKFSAVIQNIDELIVPSICIYELSKVILRERDESDLFQVLAAVQKGKLIELSTAISIRAAKNSIKYKLPMADSIIYTTAERFNAIVWTQDCDFDGLPNVNYIAK